jgi:hypothetical protein
MGVLGSTACDTAAIVHFSAPDTDKRSTHNRRSPRRGAARLLIGGSTIQSVNHVLGNYGTHALNQPNTHILRPPLAADQHHLHGPVIVSVNSSTVFDRLSPQLADRTR